MLLTVREVAEILGISRSTVYEFLYACRFPSVRIGNSRRVRRSDLETFVRDLVEVS
jgi:excisionase family DNA binding protein